MPKSLLLLILFLLIVLRHQGQPGSKAVNASSAYQRANALYNAKNPTTRSDSLALQFFRMAIDQLEKAGTGDSLLFDCYVKAGILETAKREDQPALTFFLHAIRIQKERNSIPDSLAFKPKLFAGSAFYNLNDLDSAQFYYRQAEDLIDKYPDLEEPERLYNKAGVLYYETGDYKKSIQYFTKALSLVEYGPSGSYFLVNYKNNIASALRKLGDYDQAMKMYKSLLPYKINLDELFHNIGVTYLDAGRYEEAISWLLRVKYNNQSKYNDLGRACLQLNRLDSAARHFESATRIYEKQHTTKKNFDYGITQRWMGALMMKKNLPEKSLPYFQQSIIQLDPAFNDSMISQNPKSFRGLVNSFALFDILVAKAGALRAIYTKQKNAGSLKIAFSTYASALLLANQVENEFGSEESRIFLVNNVRSAYKEAIAIGIELFRLSKETAYLREIFNYMESSKASVLQAGLRDLSLESMAGMPRELISEEKKLKASIAKSNIQIRTDRDPAQVSILEQKLVDDEVKLGSVQDQLSRNPKWMQLKSGTTRLSIDSIQHFLLPEGTALLSYFYLDRSLVCFYITAREFGLKETVIDDQLRENIFFLRRTFGTADGSDQRMIRESASFIFRQLLEPVMSNIRSATRLIIIPHNELSYVPFESLINPENEELLLRKYAISYQYSANFLSGEKPGEFGDYSVFAMAPFAEPAVSGNLSRLEYSKKELDNLNGKILLDSAATKKAFLEFAPAYPVIHLATHAVANDQDPLQSYIEFYFAGRTADSLHRLYEPEIYHVDLASARLVLLSACETGHGKLINGEGIMSLSRAFSYAGCQSVITSLWKADDAATSFIMQKLHAYLQSGMLKDEALRKAKLDYLDNAEIEPAHKTPSYWAQFVLIGDAQLIHPKNKWPPLLIGGLVLLIFLLIYQRKKYQARKSGPAISK